MTTSMKMELFESKEQYLEAIQAWKESYKENKHQFGAYHFAFYAMLRGKDPKKCFATPEQQSQRKLRSQGKHGNEAYDHAMKVIEGRYSYYDVLKPFKGKITQEQLDMARGLMKGQAA